MTPGPDDPRPATSRTGAPAPEPTAPPRRPHVDPVHGFALDAFQVAAIEALDRGESVLVAAPTGSGKTVVAEHAVAAALAAGGRAFYTTPIKALSNQKFHDLVDQHGAAQVGLLTGDNAVNGEAPVVVMTTEVLRNMIYARSGALTGLQVVVLDEVHYLQDAYRGPVWEEVIIHLPAEVRLVCLSATVSNAGELADWLTTVRGTTTVVVETTRPVSLENHYLAGDKLTGGLRWAPLLRDGRPDPDGARFDRTDAPPPGRGRGGSGGGRPRRRWYTPDRVSVVEALRERRMLPALYFIFSRAACDDAVSACLGAGLRLTDAAARHRIGEILDDHLAALGDADLAVLGYDQLRAGLDAGIASHHAGLVPPFKEAVEQCFVEGLVQVVFATETLALGINMPARSVVIEKLTKFTGEHHETLTPGQYTQLTGRAGRRGIDHEGHAVVLWSPWTSFADTAALAASRTFELTSAFRPTYNMAANLVRRYQPAEAHHLLNLSFAQFRADQSVVRLETRLDRAEERLAGLRERARCERGDVGSYAAAVDAAEAGERAARSARRRGAEAALRALRPGDVVDLPGRQDRPGVVLSVAERKGGGLRLRVLTVDRRLVTIGRDDLPDGPDRLGRVELPVPFSPGAPRFQREVLRRLERARLRTPGSGSDGPPVDDAVAAEAAAHPVAACPDRADHLRAWRRAERAAAEVGDLRRRVAQGTGSLARRFDRVLQLLEAWGVLDGWALTDKGERLVRIFHESDLLVAEALGEGLFDGLDPAALAGLASCFTYEHRSPVPPEPAWFPNADIARRVDRLDELAAELAADEERLGLPTTRPPDPTFFALAHAWAAGTALEEVLEDEDLSGGDFVRNVKQLVDLLRQLGDAAADPATAAAARQAADAVFRGVVAASAEVTT